MKSRRIAYVQYTNPAGYPPLEHSSRILADRGWEVHFLGCGSFSQANSFTFPNHPNIRIRRWNYVRPGCRQKTHYLAFALWAAWQCRKNQIDWIYASDLLACPIALLANRVSGARLLYHEHDCPPPKSSVLLAARKMVTARAAAVVVPNEPRALALGENTRPTGPLFTVWNCPTRCEVNPLMRRSGKKFVLFYHGSINPSRLPLSIVHALSLLPERVCLEIAGYSTAGSSGHLESLLREAQMMGVASRVRYLGAPTTRAELLERCRLADLGLALMPMSSSDFNMQSMAGASNKPFDYMASGLNLVISNLRDWHAFFVVPGYARSCNPSDPASLAEAVRWFTEHPAESEAARERSRQKILQEWNYETQFARVVQILEGDAGTRSH